MFDPFSIVMVPAISLGTSLLLWLPVASRCSVHVVELLFDSNHLFSDVMDSFSFGMLVLQPSVQVVQFLKTGS